MLFNPNWKTETKPDVFSLASLIAWLEKQPANEEYSYSDSEKCMMGRWLRSIDPGMELGNGCSYTYVVFGKERNFRETFWPIASRGDDRNGHTFGAALARAKAISADS